MVEPADIRAPYSGFLVDKLNKIFDSWDEEEYALALDRTLKLYYFLKKDMKKSLSPKIVAIVGNINKAMGTQGADFYMTHLHRNKALREVAAKYLPELVNELTGLLDDAGFLGITKRKVPEGHE